MQWADENKKKKAGTRRKGGKGSTEITRINLVKCLARIIYVINILD